VLLTLVLKLKRELYGNDERGETISGKRGVARASYLLRHTIYDGARTEGEYKPEGFRALLLTAGFIYFDKIVPRLDLITRIRISSAFVMRIEWQHHVCAGDE